MDGQIRRIQPELVIASRQPGLRVRKTVVKRVGDKLVRVPVDPSYATVTSLRRAILDCALQATRAEPDDSDRRLHSFIAKLSGTMEGLGERELDVVLWNLMATEPAPSEVMP
ncbi:hypothetical protein [Massilia sp.]|uniref:hypothetical protein n=1 Tax=Massilia sp. TaxID=1882437 RepID=UPI00289B38AE|nr:hypothetical protein [Massilia sp.]